jgi:hypothetical protein
LTTVCVRSQLLLIDDENWMRIFQLRCQSRVVKNNNHDEMRWNEMKFVMKKMSETSWSFKLRTNNECSKILFAVWISYAQKNRKTKTHDHLTVDYSLFHDHVQTQNFCVLYASRTNVQNFLSLILYLMMTFKRRISVFCMSFVRMLRILYLWFFISWWRSVCRTAQHASTWIRSSWFHHMSRTNKDK